MVDASVMQFYSLWEVSVFPNRCSFFKNLIVPSRFSRYWLLQLATLQLSPWNQLSYFRKPKTFNIEEQRNVIIHVNIFTYKVWKSCLRRHCCCQSTQGLIYIYTELSQSHTAAICIQAGQSDLIHFWCSFLVYETFSLIPYFCHQSSSTSMYIIITFGAQTNRTAMLCYLENIIHWTMVDDRR